jgi:hydrogenase maturation protease
MLLVCCGNADRGDDGAGPACADALRLLGVTARCLPGDAFTLLDAWTGHDDVIVVDAIVTGQAPPGTVHRFELNGGAGLELLERSLSGSSTHSFGVAEAFRLGRITKNVPAKAVIYGIEAANFEWGAGLSDEVHAAVQTLATVLARESAGQRHPAQPGRMAAGG